MCWVSIQQRPDSALKPIETLLREQHASLHGFAQEKPTYIIIHAKPFFVKQIRNIEIK